MEYSASLLLYRESAPRSGLGSAVGKTSHFDPRGRELRLKLARFTDNLEELAISCKRESLRDMCREAGIWRSGNKRALSAGPLNWRDRCRARGQAVLAEMRSLAKDRPEQLYFRFQDLS